MTSSNAFANGANQNSGNVMTGRSTTRIHHAPGGASSLSLADGSCGGMFADRAHAKEKPASYSQPVASQRPKTPQQIYAEELQMQIDAKNANKAGKKAAALQADRADEARVQREAADLSAQLDMEVAKQRDRGQIADQRSAQLANYLEQEALTRGNKGYGGADHCARVKENMDVANTFRSSGQFTSKDNSVSSNRFACGANQNSGNMITDRSTTRVHQAPGGRSSLVLG
jgi:SPIRAL1-like protein